MPARVLTFAPPALAARFAAADVRGPLSARHREELDGVLERARAFEDLPGKWQAALLAAEAGAGPPRGGCCGGGCCGGSANGDALPPAQRAARSERGRSR